MERSKTTRDAIDIVYLKGPRPYGPVWALQRALHEAVRAGARPSTLLLLEHKPTLTMGRRGGWANLKTSPERLIELGFERWQIDRGGDITYHGPGQLVGYPIVSLSEHGLELGDFLRGIETAHIECYAQWGISSARVAGFTGVWHGDDKLTAIGVRLARGVTMHGFASNVSTALEDFDHILACGLVGKGVTSLRALGVELELEVFARALVERLARCWAVETRWLSEARLPTLDPKVTEELERAHCCTQHGLSEAS